MSKIEEALRRAREAERRQSAVAPPVPSPVRNRELVMSLPGSEGRRMVEPFRREVGELAEERVIYPEMGDERVVNAFRELRTNLNQRHRAPNWVTLISALRPRGGASFVAVNLAAAVTFEEAKTALLVDCNLDHPALDRLVKEPNPIGLTDYLSDDTIGIEEIIHPTGIARLRVMPAGRRASSAGEFFTLERMRNLVSDVKSRYPDRAVVLDGPPVPRTADLRILEMLADQLVMVVPYGRAAEDEVDAAIAQLNEQKFAGVVLNDEPRPLGGQEGAAGTPRVA